MIQYQYGQCLSMEEFYKTLEILEINYKKYFTKPKDEEEDEDF